MRLTRFLLPFLLAPLTLHAQTFEELSFIRLSDQTISQRGAAMGNTSLEDPALNPTAFANIDRPLFSVALSQVEFDMFTGGFAPESRDAIGLSYVVAAVPAGDFTFSAHYKASPDIRSVRAFPEAGTETYRDEFCAPPNCYRSLWIMEPMFERGERRYGASAAWNRGRFAVGVGAEMIDLNEATSYAEAFLYPVVEENPDVSPFEVRIRRIQGKEIVPHVAVRYDLSPRATVSAAYNGAGKFERTIEACRGIETGYQNVCETRYQRVHTSTQKGIDTVRAALSIDPVENMTVVAEAVRHNYSNLTTTDDRNPPFTRTYRDATSVHFGAEFRLNSVALRAGWWRDPSRWIGFIFDPMSRNAPDEAHFTLGAGFTFGPARIDVAVDDAESPSLRRASVGVTFGAPGSRLK